MSTQHNSFASVGNSACSAHSGAESSEGGALPLKLDSKLAPRRLDDYCRDEAKSTQELCSGNLPRQKGTSHPGRDA